MSTLEKLLFLSRMHGDFRLHAFEQIRKDDLWDMGAWAYLMGEEL